jgi:hypothetical protein
LKVKAISENENLQIMLINLEKVAHNQKLVIELFIMAVVALVIIDVINKTIPNILVSISN